MEVGGGVGGQQHAATGVRLKLDPPKPFKGKMVDGLLLELWLYYRVFQKSLCAELFAGSFHDTRFACDMHWTAKPTIVQVDLSGVYVPLRACRNHLWCSL